MLGWVDDDEVLNPTAMFPFLSTATLPIQRESPSPGAYVFCWRTVAVAGLIWYQRTPAWLPTWTEWLNHRVPSLALCRAYIGRSDRVSSAEPPCSATLPAVWYEFTVISWGVCVKVLLPGFFQLTLYFQRPIVVFDSSEVRYSTPFFAVAL